MFLCVAKGKYSHHENSLVKNLLKYSLYYILNITKREKNPFHIPSFPCVPTSGRLMELTALNKSGLLPLTIDILVDFTLPVYNYRLLKNICLSSSTGEQRPLLNSSTILSSTNQYSLFMSHP